MSLRCDEQIKRIMSHAHVSKINISFERERYPHEKESRMVARVTVWCTHHHAPFGQRASNIETALARVENWLDSQDSDKWRGVSCNGQTFRKKYDHLKSREEEYQE